MSRFFCSPYLCWMLDVEQPRFSFSIANCFYPLPSDSFDELRIWQACPSGCEREVFVVSENGIRVRLYEIELVFGCQAQIDSSVAVDCQQSVNLFTSLLDICDERWIEIFVELVLQAPAFAIFLVPFRFVGSDLRFIRRHFAEDQFADRKNRQSHISHQAHVKLATLDVFLGNGVAVVFLVN